MDRSLSTLATLALTALLVACGSRTELDLRAVDGSTANDLAPDFPSDRVEVDRLLGRPDLALRSCDGSALPAPLALRSTRAEGRFGMSAVFDPAARRILSLGGSRSGGTRAAPPFSLEVDSGRVTVLRLVGVAMLPIGATAVWDSRRARALLVGGRYPEGGFFSSGRAVLEVRVQDETVTVTPLADYPAGPVSDVAAAIDPERDRLIATGGGNNSAPPSDTYGGTWALPLGAANARWLRLAGPSEGPPVGLGRQMGWDPEIHRMVIAGGFVGVTRDRRAWTFETSRWALVPGTLDAIPANVTGLLWDPRACGFVLSAGRCANELWLFRARAIPEMALLGQLQREGGFPGAVGPSLFLDSARDQFLLLGGEDCQTSGFVSTAIEQIPMRR